MAWKWAAFMPHPPIIVPEVGGGREREAAITIAGLERMMKRLREMGRPDRILVVSPHQPYAVGAFAINRAALIRGTMAPFGALAVVFDLRTPVLDADAIASFLGARDVPVALSESHDLTRDQGSLVPLYFLEGAYETLPPVILSSPVGLDGAAAYALGRALASFDDGASWGLVASGDLSHRLKQGAPAGFSPNGEKFDRTVIQSFQSGDASGLLEMPRRIIEDAGECGMRSALLMLGMRSVLGGATRVLSYEGPFGVGYCNALWTKEG